MEALWESSGEDHHCPPCATVSPLCPLQFSLCQASQLLASWLGTHSSCSLLIPGTRSGITLLTVHPMIDVARRPMQRPWKPMPGASASFHLLTLSLTMEPSQELAGALTTLDPSSLTLIQSNQGGANPNDRVEVELCGSTRGYDRDSAGDVGAGKVDKGIKESDLDSESQTKCQWLWSGVSNWGVPHLLRNRGGSS